MTTEVRREVIYRHSSTVRTTHWVNVVALLVLLMSGLQIFNAHPALYFGSKSNFDDPVMAMRPMRYGEELVGVTTIAGWTIDTTNLFGLAYLPNGGRDVRGFPWSVTLPGYRDLSTGRRWHFFFAWLFVINGLVYLIYSLASGHVAKDLAPSGRELKHIGASIWEHIRLRFPHRRAAVGSHHQTLASDYRHDVDSTMGKLGCFRSRGYNSPGSDFLPLNLKNWAIGAIGKGYQCAR